MEGILTGDSNEKGMTTRLRNSSDTPNHDPKRHSRIDVKAQLSESSTGKGRDQAVYSCHLVQCSEEEDDLGTWKEIRT
jgi:hypothetical protein